LKKSGYKIIFAAGGTGGHLFPAVAVAEALKEKNPDAEILFIGTKDKIEARVIPSLGFGFKTIWISGFSRKMNFKNLLFPLKVVVAFAQALYINMKFKPHVAVGAGAYVSGPVLWAAKVMGAAVVLLEQNSYPGVTNRMLEKKADKIHISFEDSAKYFRFKNKLELSGNPVRVNFKLSEKNKAKKEFGLNPEAKTILILGGSLGAGSINKATAENLEGFKEKGIQIIWQTGPGYFEKFKHFDSETVKVRAFIEKMDTAYSAADLLVARAGATTIAEAAYLGVPVIFVPSENVAANHQYKNAESLEKENAAILIKDSEVCKILLDRVNSLLYNTDDILKLSVNIKKFSKPDAAQKIADSVLGFAEEKIKGNI